MEPSATDANAIDDVLAGSRARAAPGVRRGVARQRLGATLSSVGSYMAKNNPSFDTRLYGFSQAQRHGSQAVVRRGRDRRRRERPVADGEAVQTEQRSRSSPAARAGPRGRRARGAARGLHPLSLRRRSWTRRPIASPMSARRKSPTPRRRRSGRVASEASPRSGVVSRRPRSTGSARARSPADPRDLRRRVVRARVRADRRCVDELPARRLRSSAVLDDHRVLPCSAMGIGSHLSRYVKDDDVLTRFVDIELLVGLLGGLSATVLFVVFGVAFGAVPHGDVRARPDRSRHPRGDGDPARDARAARHARVVLRAGQPRADVRLPRRARGVDAVPARARAAARPRPHGARIRHRERRHRGSGPSIASATASPRRTSASCARPSSWSCCSAASCSPTA